MEINRRKNKGFTLIETLLAISIFAFSITALISISARGIFDTNFVKNKLTATYLAQEGIELIRNMRDTYVVSTSGALWESFLADEISECYGPDNYCYVDSSGFSALDPEDCDNGTDCPAFYYDPQDGYFTYFLGSPNTNFTRYINVLPSDNNPANEVVITSSVEWLQGSKVYDVSFSANLTRWPF